MRREGHTTNGKKTRLREGDRKRDPALQRRTKRGVVEHQLLPSGLGHMISALSLSGQRGSLGHGRSNSAPGNAIVDL